MDDILPVLKKFFPILVMVLLMLPSAAASKKRRDARNKDKGPTPEPPPGDSELARRVQKNFEELMRRRAGESAPAPPGVEPEPWAAPSAAPVAAAPVPPPPPKAPRRPPPAPQPRIASRLRSQPGPVVGRAPRASAYSVEGNAYDLSRNAYDLEHDAYAQGSGYGLDRTSGAAGLQPDRARRILRSQGRLDRADLRRAILLKEILDRPVALRQDRGPTPGA